MTLYQAMQLNVKDLKNVINNATKREKYKYISAMILRNISCLIFCLIFITFFTTVFKPENSSVGIMGVLAILSLRFTDFDFHPNQSIIGLIIVYAICTISPHLANHVPLILGIFINFISLVLILVITSHKVNYANHFTFILGYILLWGNDVSGKLYQLRVLAMICATLFTVIIYYHCHHHKKVENTFKNIINDFFSLSKRTVWYIKISSAISIILYLGELFNFSRTMWIAFACMSVINIEYEQIKYKFKNRILFVIVGSLFFGILFTIIPKEYLGIAGIIGGLMVGFSGSYHWQTVFNCFGALATTIDLFGFLNAIIIRIIANFIGSIFSFVYHHIFERIIQIILKENLFLNNN